MIITLFAKKARELKQLGTELGEEPHVEPQWIGCSFDQHAHLVPEVSVITGDRNEGSKMHGDAATRERALHDVFNVRPADERANRP